MMERTRVLMYSEHTEFYYAWWILQNQYNSIICVTNYDEAENLLMTCTFHIIINSCIIIANLKIEYENNFWLNMNNL